MAKAACRGVKPSGNGAAASSARKRQATKNGAGFMRGRSTKKAQKLIRAVARVLPYPKPRRVVARQPKPHRVQQVVNRTHLTVKVHSRPLPVENPPAAVQ